MSSGLEHRECAEALAAYALGALPEAEGTRVRLHLDSCHECRAELDWLRAAVDALPASVQQLEPPPKLRARVMEIVEAESALLHAAGPAADGPEPVAGVRGRRWPFRWSLTGALGAALAVAAVCVATVVVVLAATGGGAGTRTIQAQITEPAAARATVALRVSGTRATLVVSGLPAPSADHVDEVWVVHGKGAPQPAGTFVLQSGAVEVGRAVSPGDLVLVTVERGRGTAAPTGKPFIVARV